MRGLITATIATAAVGAVFTLAGSNPAGQAPAGRQNAPAGRGAAQPAARGAQPARGGVNRAPRNAWDGKPNMNGVWQANNTANWDLQDHAASPGPFYQLGAIGAVPPGQTVVEGGDIPYLPAAAEQKRKNFLNRLTDDPEVKCYLPGLPRATYMPYPFQIVQSPKNILFAYEYASANRVVNMDKPTEAPVDSWMGWSNGKWEGDTLVVDVRSLNGKAWLDRSGDHMTDNAHIVERYTMIDADHINYEATIEDNKLYSRPWKISMPLYKRVEKNAQILEFKCVEFAEEMLYGHLRKGAPSAGK
ncbi:MAG: hypothetical protein ABI868_03585 [Acidobacteriota bacterium]